MKQLTERDKEMLCFIASFQEEHGYSPSLREIGKGLYMSVATTQRHLYKMVELGYLKITPRTPRSIVLNMTV